MKKNPNSLEARLAAYGSMSLAMAAVAMPGMAHGGMLTYSGDDLTTSATQAVYFDPATGYAGLTSSGSFDFELVTNSFGGGYFRDSIFVAPNNGGPNGNLLAVSASSLVAKLSPLQSIGGGMNFGFFGTLAGNVASAATAHWNALPANGDLGLSQTTGCNVGTCYAWANITVNPDYSITLNTFGYDNSGAPVADPGPDPAPEPASIVLLAMGAAGIAAWRRRKAAVK